MMMMAIQTASSSRITTAKFRCRRSQFTDVIRYRRLSSGIPDVIETLKSNGADLGSRQLPCDQSAAEQGDQRTRLRLYSWSLPAQKSALCGLCPPAETAPECRPRGRRFLGSAFVLWGTGSSASGFQSTLIGSRIRDRRVPDRADGRCAVQLAGGRRDGPGEPIGAMLALRAEPARSDSATAARRRSWARGTPRAGPRRM
jgi:hypothetical protein